jgi:two-component system chemotaxis response regulator CheB
MTAMASGTERESEIVGVGASLGGLDALETLFGALPPDFACPIVLVQHRMPQVEGLLVELLQGYSARRVVEPEDKDPIEPGHIYLAPPNYHLLVERGFFSLSVDPPVSFARPSIDVLFESLADSYGRGALGVVLTGSNKDGASGAAAIKRAGGRVLVQDPRTAESPVAPLAVLAATEVDAVLDLKRMAERIAHLAR